MPRGATNTDTRQRRAREGLDAWGDRRAEAERMTVQCRRSHHLGAVFETDVGPVVITHPGPHAHGSKDFTDTGHHGARRADRLDLLDAGPGVGDGIPAWCDCGPVELSRSDLLARLDAGEHRVIVGR
jgi:hypothetical protein